MELIDINTEDKTIMQHNSITSGRYDFSACMLDVLFMVLASLEKDKLVYTIHTGDIEAITGRNWNIEQLTKSTEAMLTKMFEIEDSKSYIQFVLFQYFKYLKGQRSIEVKLSEIALPYFFELKNNFTAMQLKSVLGCSSKYAKRLYGIACQWRSVGSKRFEITELKKMLGLIDKKGNEQYERISDFKKFVLDIAKDQINENTDIDFDYDLKKRGRSYHWVTLHFQNRQFKQLEFDFNNPINIDLSIEKQKFKSNIMAYGLTESQASIIIENTTLTQWDEIIKNLNNSVRQGKIKIDNSVAYLIGVLQNMGKLPRKSEK
ncbi:replication initiation protein [Riemerella columbipharyngis]|uniref:Initiator Replication protein n=1 Tax=Riemerella columbipharyngis TaxID=1071918 RepID=A0A1G7FQL9_9FLAO|nr:replication initiation protein [Riemerella columbipharyngis]SDE78187.1 Initiator Replication protein [Riemerella columbipharyngis]